MFWTVTFTSVTRNPTRLSIRLETLRRTASASWGMDFPYSAVSVRSTAASSWPTSTLTPWVWPPPPPVIEPAPVEAPPPPVVEAPPPPPPPAPPVFQPREFLVYFPFDQSILTPEAQTVVQEAASHAAGGGATRVAVTGHADTSGSAAYNIRLSERRARAVADAMVGLGVNPALITADWRGEAEPAVSTGDGVKEPLNRRATVAIN